MVKRKKSRKRIVSYRIDEPILMKLQKKIDSDPETDASKEVRRALRKYLDV